MRFPLSQEQREAAYSDGHRVFIESAPGSGKTRTAAERFGVVQLLGPHDPRAVLAVSFTRAATNELRTRIRRRWGTAVLLAPHRVTTLDDVHVNLLGFLLRSRRIHWPGGHVEITVRDSWKGLEELPWTQQRPVTLLDDDRHVVVRRGRSAERANHVLGSALARRIAGGECTHDDVRTILLQAMTIDELRQDAVGWIGRLYRHVVVDEVFDADELDVALIELALNAGIDVTLVGDPWQALYRFRGARPDRVVDLVDRAGFHTLPLTRSYRFESEEMRTTSSELRRGEAVQLPSHEHQPDVVLARKWKPLRAESDWIMPLSLGAPRSPQVAAATLLLNRLLLRCLGVPTTYRDDALVVLGGRSLEELTALEATLDGIVDSLADVYEDNAELKVWWAAFSKTVEDWSGVHVGDLAPAHYERLRAVGTRVRSAPALRPVPGMTIHQAKGQEWERVHLLLGDEDVARLAEGLDIEQDGDRALYVAVTRARVACTTR